MAGINFLKNGDFEEWQNGVPVFWAQYGTCQRIENGRLQGNASLRQLGTGDIAQYMDLGINYGKGRRFRLRIFGKGLVYIFFLVSCHGVTHYLQPNKTWRAPGDPDYVTPYFIVGTYADWTEFVIDDIVPDPSTDGSMGLALGGEGYYDCALFTETPGNLVMDGGFEDWASASDLTHYTEYLSGGTIAREATEKHSGAFAVKSTITNPGGTANVLHYPTLKPGTYRISVWHKSAGSQALKTIYYWDGTQAHYLQPDKTFKVYGEPGFTYFWFNSYATEWTFETIVATFPANLGITIELCNFSVGSVYYDDLAITEVGIARFADLVAAPIAAKDFLIKTKPREWHQAWTKTAGYTNVYETDWHDIFDLSGADQGAKIPDGSFEDWATPTTLNQWAEYSEGGSSVNREATTKRGGTYGLRLDIDASGNTADVYQTIVKLKPGKLYRLVIWYKSAPGQYIGVALVETGWAGAWLGPDGYGGAKWFPTNNLITLPPASDWTAAIFTFRGHPNFSTFWFGIGAGTNWSSAASTSIYIDDVTFEGIAEPNTYGSIYRQLEGVSENGTPYVLRTGGTSFSYFGQNDNGDGYGTRDPNYIKGCRFQNTAGTGTLTEIGINLQAALTGNLRIGVYADAAGSPGALLLDAGEFVNPGAGWNSKTGLSLAVTNGAYYWLSWNISAQASVYHNTGFDIVYRSVTYGALPDPFGSATPQSGIRTSMRAGVSVVTSDPLAAVDTNAGSYYWNAANHKLYVHALSSGNPNSASKYITSSFMIFTASGIDDEGRGKIFDGIFYEPIFDSGSIPSIEAEQVDFLSGGGLAVSSATLQYRNHQRFFDYIFEKWIWKNAPVSVYFGGESLPLSEYTLIFAGKIIEEKWREDGIAFECVDNLDLMKRNVPVNPLFGDNVIEADRGKPIPLCFGYVESIMPLCIDASAPAASIWQIADPAYQTLYDIVAVYDGTTNVTANVTKDLTNCKFTFVSYTPTGVVSCDVRGAKISDIPGESSAEMMTNAADIVRFFLKKILRLTDDEIDLPSFAAARAETLDVQLAKYVRYRRNLSSYIEEIERSVFGNLHQTTEGKFAFDIFSPLYAEDDTLANYEWEGDYEHSSPLSKMYSGVKVLYRPLPIDRPEGAGVGEDDVYSVSEGTNARALYVENQDAAYKLVVTWLANTIDADSLRDRVRFLTNVPNITIDASVRGIKLFQRRPGDVLKISKAIAPGLNRAIANQYFQIIKIIKEFANDRATIRLDNFQGAAFFVGSWTDDSAPAWAAATDEQKDTQGFWTDDDGFADPSDTTSKNRSLWY